MTISDIVEPRRRHGEAGERLLEVKGLKTSFYTRDGVVRAVTGIDFHVDRGEILGLVGESGCGKSVTSLSLLRLIAPPGRIEAGEVIFDGRDLMTLGGKEIRALRGNRISMIFQQPTSSLNPVFNVGSQLEEVLQLHQNMKRRAARDRAEELLRMVGIPDPARRLAAFPHSLSGGMAQRVMIAMALACEPELLIADEPTTALDVTIQAQILDLIRDLQQEIGSSVILVTHDLGVVAGTTDRIIVMYAGHVFESAGTAELFARPANPYTRGLLLSVPDPAADTRRGELYQIPGLPPDVAHLPPGCPFAPRCDRAEDVCRREFPPFMEVAPGHRSLCHFAAEVFGSGRP